MTRCRICPKCGSTNAFVHNGKRWRCRICGYEEKELKQMKFG